MIFLLNKEKQLLSALIAKIDKEKVSPLGEEAAGEAKSLCTD